MGGVIELLENKDNTESVEFLTLDFRDAFKQLHVVASERWFLAGAGYGRFLLVQDSAVRGWIRTFGVVPGGCVGHAQHSGLAVQQQSADQLFRG